MVEEGSELTEDRSLNVKDIADNVLKTLLRKHEDLTVLIADREGRCISSTLPKIDALEQTSCVLEFTDKAKNLMRKVLPDEELLFVRIRGKFNEIVVTFDNLLMIEIITIQKDSSRS